MEEKDKFNEANEPEGIYMSISEWNLLKQKIVDLGIDLPKTDSASYRKKFQEQTDTAELDIQKNRTYTQDEMLQKVKSWKS